MEKDAVIVGSRYKRADRQMSQVDEEKFEIVTKVGVDNYIRISKRHSVR